jgi:hypothetical protein
MAGNNDFNQYFIQKMCNWMVNWFLNDYSFDLWDFWLSTMLGRNLGIELARLCNYFNLDRVQGYSGVIFILFIVKRVEKLENQFEMLPTQFN